MGSKRVKEHQPPSLQRIVWPKKTKVETSIVARVILRTIMSVIVGLSIHHEEKKKRTLLFEFGNRTKNKYRLLLCERELLGRVGSSIITWLKNFDMDLQAAWQVFWLVASVATPYSCRAALTIV